MSINEVFDDCIASNKLMVAVADGSVLLSQDGVGLDAVESSVFIAEDFL